MGSTTSPELIISVYTPEGRLQGRATGPRGRITVEPGASKEALDLFALLTSIPTRRRRPC